MNSIELARKLGISHEELREIMLYVLHETVRLSSIIDMLIPPDQDSEEKSPIFPIRKPKRKKQHEHRQ